MAEYYPLISRAVAGLRSGTPEARRVIYDRARQALIGQLQSLDPPVPEDAIARETAALDEAIARAEAEVAGSQPAPVAAEPSPPPPAAAPPPQNTASRPTVRPAAPGLPKPPAPPIRPAVATRPPRPPGLSIRDPLPDAPSAAPPLSVGVAARAPAAPPPSAPHIEAASAPVLPAATALKVEPADQPSESMAEDETRAGSDSIDRRNGRDGDRGRDEASRPAAPRPTEAKRPNLRVLIVSVVALAAVVVIAFTAWRLRDQPQDLARVPVAAQAPAPVGKIGERAGGDPGTTSQPAAVVASDRASQTSTEQPATSPNDQQAAATVSQPQPAVQAAVTQPAAAPSEPAIPIAYKAAILVDAPDLPEKVKTYIGTVVWRLDNVAQGQDQPTGTAIRAQVDIPDAKIQLSVQIRRNTEAQFPASHTMDLKFTVAADSPIGSIKQINVPQMRQNDMPTGDPLAGIPVTIADNNFLVGLVRGTAEERNIELLRSRNWFDVPMLLANGKASKVTFEKGTSGNRIFNDVLDSWKNAQN